MAPPTKGRILNILVTFVVVDVRQILMQKQSSLRLMSILAACQSH